MPEEMRKLGVEFAIRQCQDLIRNGVRYIHFYSMNRSDSLQEILKALNLQDSSQAARKPGRRREENCHTLRGIIQLLTTAAVLNL